MDQSTHDVRRANRFNIITECQQRPADVSVKQLLADNGVKEKAYYYWLRKFRHETCEQMNLPSVTASADLSFAEIPLPMSILEKSAVKSNAVAVIHTSNITLEVSQSLSCACFYRRWHMLEDVLEIRRVVLAYGTVDPRKGIDGLAMVIGYKYKPPYEKGALFLFCGGHSYRIKGLLWIGTGFILLYKRFEDGRLSCQGLLRMLQSLRKNNSTI